MLHFAYGEDMSPHVFKESCPGAEWSGPARLEGHRLVFDPGGRANVKAQTGATVWGSLWLVPAARLPDLDAGAAGGYRRTTRRIVSPAGPRTEAMLYLSEATGTGTPSPERLRGLLAAAKESRLPTSYQGELKAVLKAAEDSR